jgi:serine/threonine protein kinase
LDMDHKSSPFAFPEVGDRYHVAEKTGEGTFSSVYKAVTLDDRMDVVALKRIYPTCSPQRILNEIKFLYLLGGKGNVSPLLDVLRYRDQVTLVLPFVDHLKFKVLVVSVSSPCEGLHASHDCDSDSTILEGTF